MEFNIEEDFLAGTGKFFCEFKPANRHQLITDFIKRTLIANRVDGSLRVLRRRKVEGDDQAVF